MPDNVKNIEINGRQLHYIDQGGEGKHPAIIFIHGGLDDYRCWQFQVDSFSKKYRAISYSRRFAYPNRWIGNVSQDNTIEDNAKDLAELIRKLDVAPAHLVGASYGAFITFYCASKNPELVRTMVLNEPPIFEFLANSSIKEDVELLQAFITRVQKPSQDAFKRGDFEKGVQIFMDTIMNRENFFEKLPEEVKEYLLDNAKSLDSELESAKSTSFTIEDVKQITSAIPTLQVKGELSPKLFLRTVDILSENMPNNTEQIVIPNVSHDDFKLGSIFTSKVMEFFARHD
ncbi:MAG TPA: alpha/beta hydrolase [Nitrososphaeraceae archaeon]|jgi:pimeloyl-ACP methyl ester carboxylesterase|nr:alpha/beta hydrolase [Nitrososphaeraceae archaeon]